MSHTDIPKRARLTEGHVKYIMIVK
uniref:Uncharacterized protein n=1 Tax=Lepeophtheirus salmonis TaxID=72036 RepID=A0A0K2UDM4_LEPSM